MRAPTRTRPTSPPTTPPTMTGVLFPGVLSVAWGEMSSLPPLPLSLVAEIEESERCDEVGVAGGREDSTPLIV